MNLILLQADASLFIGRLHPLIVHLPIGFLLLAVIFYFLSFFKPLKGLRNSLQYILLFGAISALVSVGVGLLLASKGGYDMSLLDWHKWLAIILVIISFSLWAWVKWGKGKQIITAALMLSVLLLLTFTGHLGGTLTHGERYIFEYAPEFIRSEFLINNGVEPDKLVKDTDSIFLYADLVRPVLNQKCISCHNNENSSGGLNLTNLDSLLEGGDNGPVVIAGNVAKSEMFKRVSMNPHDRKFMPTNGAPLSYTEMIVLQEWIKHDLDTTIAITANQLSAEFKQRLAISYGLDTRQKSFVEKLKLPKLPDSLISKLNKNKFMAGELAQDLNLLSVKSKDTLTTERLALLSSVKEHIVWLSLNGASISQAQLETIGTFENLVRLDLHNNPITNIAALTNLKHLEVLNLHTTLVNDSIIGSVNQLPALKTIYLWQSKMTEQAVDSLRTMLPDLEVDFGFKLRKIEKKDPERS